MWIIVIPWALAIMRSFTRTLSFFAFLAITSAAMLLAALLETPIRIVVQVLIAAAWGAAFLFPEKLRLGALTADEVEIDDSIRAIVAVDGRPPYSTSTSGLDASERLDTFLARSKSLDPRWYQVASLLRAGSGSASDALDTPSAWFTLAARHYWHDVRNRRVLGRRPMAGPWDFDVYLHVQFFWSKSSTDAETLREIVKETRSAPAPDPEWARVRDLLAEVIAEPDQSALFAPATDPQGGDLRVSRLHEAWRIAAKRYRPEGISGAVAPDPDGMR